LNMVKHCQENADTEAAQWGSMHAEARGLLMGVLKHDIGLDHNNLFIT